jgi:hypothetical protein
MESKGHHANGQGHDDDDDDGHSPPTHGKRHGAHA